MNFGDVVQNKLNGIYGTVEYSTFGFSIHTINEKGHLQKTLGYPAREILKHWNVVPMPEGYVKGEYGGLRKA